MIKVELLKLIEVKFTDCSDLQENGIYTKHINECINIEIDINKKTMDLYDIENDILISRKKLTLNNLKSLL
jgi:hypothetical protein